MPFFFLFSVSSSFLFISFFLLFFSLLFFSVFLFFPSSFSLLLSPLLCLSLFLSFLPLSLFPSFSFSYLFALLVCSDLFAIFLPPSLLRLSLSLHCPVIAYLFSLSLTHILSLCPPLSLFSLFPPPLSSPSSSLYLLILPISFKKTSLIHCNYLSLHILLLSCLVLFPPVRSARRCPFCSLSLFSSLLSFSLYYLLFFLSFCPILSFSLSLLSLFLHLSFYLLFSYFSLPSRP